jgi:cytidyltransferase-like protein
MIFDIKDKWSYMAAVDFAKTLKDSAEPDKTKTACLGMIMGCWDLFHHLHLHMLRRAKNYCQHLIVGVATDRYIAATKGDGLPYVPQEHRIQIVDAIKYVDMCFLVDHEDDVNSAAVRLVMNNHGVFFDNQERVGRFRSLAFYRPDYSPEAGYNPSMVYKSGNVIIIPEVKDKYYTTTGAVAAGVAKIVGRNPVGIKAKSLLGLPDLHSEA